MALETFDQQLDKTNGNVPSILLGNGFSRAWDNTIFDYKNLFQLADFGSRDAILRRIFTDFSTYDFEKIMQALEAAELICQTYNANTQTIDDIRNDKHRLKDSLIEVIAHNHPERSSHVTTAQYDRAKPFISQFENVFTLNYDLLLYWIINKTEIAPLGYHHNDGFRGDTWIGRPEQNIFFLHGGLHLYDTGTHIKKHLFRETSGTSIAEQVANNLNHGNFPLFVSEPTSENKLEQIKHNPYLNACFSALKNINGHLFIHGHSISENDNHIFKKIQESNVTDVYVSIFGDENSPTNRECIANSHRFIQNHNISVQFYDASTAPIWN
ncbi:DUF4917 family protein [Serratia sp. TSA_130.2]|uniref:DUF4917 family protein n=1 Tax=Serratia TaxID=613 RepID=UPI0006399341|nr:DUF4917 family protein [Serratia ureilytica]KKO56984.1 hypothetical protein LG59_933 [Serratia ureilytica]PKR40587.1 DUF4917 domain-containing protein [Serratia ureilytica]